MRNNIIATYSHNDSEVRFLLRYTFATGVFAGITVGAFLCKLLN